MKVLFFTSLPTLTLFPILGFHPALTKHCKMILLLKHSVSYLQKPV